MLNSPTVSAWLPWQMPLALDYHSQYCDTESHLDGQSTVKIEEQEGWSCQKIEL